MSTSAPGHTTVDDRLWELARPSPRGAIPTLRRTHQLLALLGNPQEQLSAVHVGGTSGKGSTCHFLAAILQAAGYPVGMHSKPHLATVRERLVKSGDPISAEELSNVLIRLRPLLESAPWLDGRPTWFELVVALAFDWFRSHDARPVVVEVGLGGTWDATNVLHPLVSVVTNVGLDHTELLGTSVEAIAQDKAGILKPGATAITGASQPSVQAILADRARQVGQPLWQLGREIVFQTHSINDHGACFDLACPGATIHDLQIGMLGRHQVENAALAVAAAVALAEHGFSVPEVAVRHGLATCRVPGRLERFAGTPDVLLDGAHNPEKMAALAAALGLLAPQTRPVCVVAMRRGHDIAGTLAPLLTVAGGIILTQISAGTDWGREQSIDPALLLEAVGAISDPAIVMQRGPDLALDRARNIAGPKGLVCVTGSLYLVGQLRERLLAGR